MLGWDEHLGVGRPGQSPGAIPQGFPQVCPLFCIVWLSQAGPWGRGEVRRAGGNLPHPPSVCLPKAWTPVG